MIMKEQTIQHSAVCEAILFMSGKAVSFARIAELMDISVADVQDIVASLQQSYDARDDTGLKLLVKDEHVQMVTRPAVADVIEEMTKKELEGPLTPVAMEVLSIIAYRGPIAKVDIEAVRGVNCAFTLRNLMRRGLIERVKGDEGKRTQQYQVTMDFLRLLGVASVEELPEFMELSRDKRVDAILYNDAASE
ncbi:SMC-Scp complex subunit ScpB [candidate division KSB3 bacterium]|uniref:SMC-Scp complex subunit ScpB n=1 Tax=candidate division KSB3 bacterium TaxID=2044937 RepID=A0A2G6E184_9BACT|nr:MAG: SMC-Scp complex subunit ScpB [candidate division KSB3 bacterium]